ncbi:MAG: hypothetical protein PUD65_11120 [Spirochaetales bacterium]|nr:hypothetical protein [Spirochaetales bacterium]
MKLPVPTNSVKIGFSSSISDAESGTTTNEFSMKAPEIDEAFNISSEDNGDIYLFYKGVGVLANCKLSLEIVRPFTWFDGTGYSSSNEDMIDYSIKILCNEGCYWDGSKYSKLTTDGITILSSGESSKQADIETSFRGEGAEMNMVKGVARVSVTIPSTDVTGKKYGTYKSELKLTLTSN